jgi:hypothetical protein
MFCFLNWHNWYGWNGVRVCASCSKKQRVVGGYWTNVLVEDDIDAGGW